VGERAGAQGSLSLSHANACNPLLQAHPPWAQDNTKAAGSHLLLLPPPLVFRLAPTHLGWDTQRQFTRRSRDPSGSKRQHYFNAQANKNSNRMHKLFECLLLFKMWHSHVMVNRCNTPIYRGNIFFSFISFLTNYKLGITNPTPLTRILSSRFRKD
jgi:hypothetical protein